VAARRYTGSRPAGPIVLVVMTAIFFGYFALLVNWRRVVVRA
jgi:hypothetical protein